MLIAVDEINQRTNKKALWDTRINADRIDYLRFDNKDCYVKFSSGNSMTITSESAERLIKVLYGDDRV